MAGASNSGLFALLEAAPTFPSQEGVAGAAAAAQTQGRGGRVRPGTGDSGTPQRGRGGPRDDDRSRSQSFEDAMESDDLKQYGTTQRRSFFRPSQLFPQTSAPLASWSTTPSVASADKWKHVCQDSNAHNVSRKTRWH
eukprot:9494637-Pyramimonas_sp.AAC.1